MRMRISRFRWTALGLAGVLALTSVACAPASLDIDSLETQIEDWAMNMTEDLFGERAKVSADCPDDARAETGYTFVCALDEEFDGGADMFHVIVTVLNENGDVEWELSR